MIGWVFKKLILTALTPMGLFFQGRENLETAGSQAADSIYNNF
jgi:hypothetical protein